MMAGRFRICTLGAISIALAACSHTAVLTEPVAPSHAGLHRIANIAYGTGATRNGDMPLYLDYYGPDAPCSQPRPVLIFIHGGGFVEGDKTLSSVPVIAEALAGHGIATLSINYRLLRDEPQVTGGYAVFAESFASREDNRFGARAVAAAAAAEDSVAAMRWVEEAGEDYCLDAGRMGLWGSSAGAMTALNVAYALDDFGIEAPRPRVVVDYFGQLFVEGVMQPGEPPLLIVHGDADDIVEFAATRDLVDWSSAAGIPFAFQHVEGGGHGFRPLGFYRVRINDRSMADAHAQFVADHLIDGGEPVYEMLTLSR